MAKKKTEETSSVKVLPSMAKIYARLIQNGMKTLEEIPEAYRDAVKKLLEGEEPSGEGTA